MPAATNAAMKPQKEESDVAKFANTEVRIPLYDRSWDSLVDVLTTLAHINSELRLEQSEADLILIEIEWEEAARNDEGFMALVEKYIPAQYWLRFERR